MIVITTDGSERSFRSIDHAAAFARSVGSELRLLRVIDPEEEAGSGTLSWPKRLKAAVARIEDELQAAVTAANIEAQPSVGILYKGESTTEAILRCADELGAQMIVMDSRGHGSIRHALLGSVAMGVLSVSEVPVMVTGPNVKPPPESDGYRVLATSDGSQASEHVLRALRPLLVHTRVDLLTVYVPRLGDAGEHAEVTAAYERLAELQRQMLPGIDCHTMVISAPDFKRAEDIAIEAAAEVGANALAMSTQGYSALRHVLLGSFAAACLGQSPIPIILAR